MATLNAPTRKNQLEKMRAGEPLYQEDKDIVRGLLSDLKPQEAIIIVGTSANTDKVNIRMGDVAYTSLPYTPAAS